MTTLPCRAVTGPAESITELVSQVQRIVEESGNPLGFNALDWTMRWLEDPHPALGGRTPSYYMDRPDGRSMISALIAQMQSGAYA